MGVRTAESSDLERMLDLAEAKRDLYREMHTRFSAQRTMPRSQTREEDLPWSSVAL